MAGSRKWFIYTDDDGTDSAVQLDEDTGSLAGLGFQPYAGSPVLDVLPKGFKMRYINAVQTSGAGSGFRYRSFPCGSDDADLYSGDITTFTINGLTYSVTSTRGEKSRRPTAINTGLVGSSPTVGTSTGGGASGGGGTT
jgi:hypothetical protein